MVLGFISQKHYSNVDRIARRYDGLYYVDHTDDQSESEKVEQSLDLFEEKERDWKAALQGTLKDTS